MDVAFCAELTNIKTIHNVLKAITFKEYCTIRIMEEGVKVTVEELKVIQISAYIPQNVFNKYQIKNTDDDNDIMFRISLKIFTECLNIFGDDNETSLKIVYKELGSPLNLILFHNEENITANCDIRTMEVDDLAELSLADQCTVNNIVVYSQQFVKLLTELDNSADVFEIIANPDVSIIKMCAIGTLGESQINIPKTSDMVIMFKINSVFSAQYMFSYIKQLNKVMTLASKVSISTGDQGLLGMQLIINMENDKQMYVEYYVSALLQNN